MEFYDCNTFDFFCSAVCSEVSANLRCSNTVCGLSLIQQEHSSKLTTKDAQLTAKDAENSRLSEDLKSLQVYRQAFMYWHMESTLAFTFMFSIRHSVKVTLPIPVIYNYLHLSRLFP